MPAVIELSFDPLLRLGELTLRLQTIGVTAALLAALSLAWAAIERTPALRRTDLLPILVGIVPGAVVGGRIVHVLGYAGAYLDAPLTVLDPRVGSLSLLGAVLGGTAGALYVVRLLRAPATTWADLAAAPLLLALGLGKAAQLLGGSGQGLPFDGSWAVAFGGDGPWVNANPAMAAHPAQLYEAAWLLIGIAAVYALARWRPELGRPGLRFAAALGWFIAGRVIVGFTWRDSALIGPLNAEQLLALAALLGTLLLARRGIVEPIDTQPRPAAREPAP